MQLRTLRGPSFVHKKKTSMLKSGHYTHTHSCFTQNKTEISTRLGESIRNKHAMNRQSYIVRNKQVCCETAHTYNHLFLMRSLVVIAIAKLKIIIFSMQVKTNSKNLHLGYYKFTRINTGLKRALRNFTTKLKVCLKHNICGLPQNGLQHNKNN